MQNLHTWKSNTLRPTFQSLTNAKNLLEKIADRIGAVQEKSVNKLWISIANKLSDGTVLIFDESQHPTTKAIEIIRSLSDYFNDK